MRTLCKKTCIFLLAVISFLTGYNRSNGQSFKESGSKEIEDFHVISGEVDFDFKLREWDGFGVNYVQTAHTKDYSEWPQEYGGFSLLPEAERDTIADMIFGSDGLKPGLVKMFLDPLHQKKPGGEYDHTTTTKWMLDFVERGLKTTREDGRDLQIMTTLYSPPAYMTLQKKLRGRDIDPAHKKDLALYMIDWAKFLQDRGIPIRHISLHNEGEDWRRWPADGHYTNFDLGNDYNLYWRPGQVAEFIAEMPSLMEKKGLKGVSVTNGEPSRFFQFQYSGYAKAIMDNPQALKNLSLITSHNFYRSLAGHRWFSGTSNVGTNWLREKKPGLKAWVTSASWGNMNTDFVWQLYMNIYLAEVNGYIPWAVIQRPKEWLDGDPNPGTAFRVREDGSWEVLPGYYWYKQVSRAGQPGMAVAYTECMDSEIQLIGFASNGTKNNDNFIVINSGVNITYRADAIDLNIDGEHFHFSSKDPNMNRARGGKYQNLEHRILSVEEGYLAEFAIPWSRLKSSPDAQKIRFNIVLKNGEHSHESSIKWNSNGKITPDNKSEINGGTLVEILKATLPVEVDAKEESSWQNVTSISIDEPDHPNKIEGFKGSWKAMYDDEHLYLLVRVYDESNLQGRDLSIGLKGTKSKTFDAYRTSENGELYEYLGEFESKKGKIRYISPSKSVTTFFGK